MPRNGSGVYSADWVNASPNTTIESAKQNAMVADLVTDANAARPITAGGTARTTARLLDGTWRFENTADPTKLLAYDLSPLTTATTRTQIVPDENGRQALAAHLSGYLYGLTLSNNGTDATNDIDIATGVAIDSANAHVMTLASALTKRLDAAWAVGTGNGGLDTGTIADTTYHVWLIKRVDTGVVDVLFSTSASSPTMPTNYTLKRRIGSIMRASSAIRLFTQIGDTFKLNSLVTTTSAADPGASAVTRILAVPAGLALEAIFIAGLTNSSTGVTPVALFSSFTETDEVPTTLGGAQIGPVANTTGYTYAAATELRIITNTASEIRSRLSASDASVTIGIKTKGWIDTRGRLG